MNRMSSMMPLLAPLVWVYGSVVRARNARLDRATPYRLNCPVISVGNLSLGGAGKTPLVIALARLLAREGCSPDVLSRGYGRTGQDVAQVDPAGSADLFGDEPLLIAQAAGVPVFVGNQRYQAGLLAERDGQQHVHLLDDGFQHRHLARDLDIVVVHRTDLDQRLLPAGRLREPLSSLRRADVIVLRSEDAELEGALRPYLRPDCTVWRVRRTLDLPSGELPQRPIAFCAIARPQEFFDALAKAGVSPVKHLRFRDHHRYTSADMDRLVSQGRHAGCDAFMTTSKDAVKLTAALRQQLQVVAPLHQAALTVTFEDEPAVLRQLRAFRKSFLVCAR